MVGNSENFAIRTELTACNRLLLKVIDFRVWYMFNKNSYPPHAIFDDFLNGIKNLAKGIVI